MAVCDYLLPTREAGLVPFGSPLPSCLLEAGHKGDHLIRTASGKYAVFMPFTEACGEVCECAEDTETIHFECFTWSWITQEEAERMLSGKN